MERLATEQGWRLVVHAKSACAFADHLVWVGRYKRAYTECADWGEAVMAEVARERPALVVLASSRFIVLDVDGRPVQVKNQPEPWDAALARRIEQLRGSAAHVAILGDTPFSSFDVPECVARTPGDLLACSTPSSTAVAVDRHARDRVVAERTGATFIDPDPLVCPTEPCPPIIGNTLVFRDRNHLTHTFSVALAPYLLPDLPPLE